MSEYYYFVSTLPMLSVDRSVPITYQDFLSKAKEQLSRKDYEDLRSASFDADGKAHARLVRSWQSFVSSVKDELIYQRAKRLGIAGYERPSYLPKELADRIEDAVNDDNPLDAEKEILSLYFDFLSDNDSSSQFSSDALMVYGLKLQILERLESFDTEKGRAEFGRLFKDIQKEIFDKE